MTGDRTIMTVDVDDYYRMSDVARDAITSWIERHHVDDGSGGVTAITIRDEGGCEVLVRRFTLDEYGHVLMVTDGEGIRRGHQHEIIFTVAEPFPVHVLAEKS